MLTTLSLVLFVVLILFYLFTNVFLGVNFYSYDPPRAPGPSLLGVRRKPHKLHSSPVERTACLGIRWFHPLWRLKKKKTLKLIFLALLLHSFYKSSFYGLFVFVELVFFYIIIILLVFISSNEVFCNRKGAQ